jgi:hypothetical protein
LSLLITVTAIVGLVVVAVLTDSVALTGIGSATGVLIGTVLVMPQRRLLARLGLSPEEARLILETERERRSGAPALTPAARARRESARGALLTLVGFACVVAFVVAASYFFGKAGQTVEEDAPTDPWFAASFFIGFAAACAGPALLSQARTHFRTARSWRAEGQ